MNKYQESLDWIKLQLIGGNEEWFKKKNECLNTLQELIDNYGKLEKVLDKACEVIVEKDGITCDQRIQTNCKYSNNTWCRKVNGVKKCWKKWLLSEASK